MDAPEGSPERPAETKSGIGLPSWKSVIEFLTAMADLRRTVDGLRESNKSLREDVVRLQRQVDEQAGPVEGSPGIRPEQPRRADRQESVACGGGAFLPVDFSSHGCVRG
jgi:hypothetical protein